MYSTEHPLGPGSEQREWIASQLSSADRASHPWLVLAGHRPLYVASTNSWAPDGDQPAGEEARASLEALLMEHRVDLTIHGHHHSYQRSCPALRGACVDGPDALGASAAAPVHVVVGNGGAALSLNVPLAPAPIWRSVKLGWGYLRVEATGGRLKAEMVSDADSRAMDRFELRKPEGWGEAFMRVRRRGGGGVAGGGGGGDVGGGGGVGGGGAAASS